MEQDELQTAMRAVSEMTNHAGWGFLKKYFQPQIDALQDEINQVGQNELKYSYGDIKKLEMRNLKDLLNFPQNFLELNKRRREEEDDPYNQN